MSQLLTAELNNPCICMGTPDPGRHHVMSHSTRGSMVLCVVPTVSGYLNFGHPGLSATGVSYVLVFLPLVRWSDAGEEDTVHL